jgi:hypothetical protein
VLPEFLFVLTVVCLVEERDIRERIVAIIGRSRNWRVRAPEYAEDRSDALAVAHRAQLRQ